MQEITLDEVYETWVEHCQIMKELKLDHCTFVEFCEHIKEMRIRII